MCVFFIVELGVCCVVALVCYCTIQKCNDVTVLFCNIFALFVVLLFLFFVGVACVVIDSFSKVHQQRERHCLVLCLEQH